MTKLILVRHGQTEWNVQRRYQGQTDIPLNDVGRQQATALALRLEGEDMAAIYASDLKRTRQTAQAIAERCGLLVHDEPRLREMCFGDWEGLTHAEIEARWPDEQAAWYADPTNVAPPGGETLAQVVTRVKAAANDIVREAQERTVALVAHGGTLRVLVCQAMGIEPPAFWRLRADPASISELHVYDQTAILARLNDTHHLPAKGSEKNKWDD
jgi:alpha-ribazole phosphatase